MTKSIRPLSPHLSIYKFQMTMTLSILHRITGVALFIGSILLFWYIIGVIYKFSCIQNIKLVLQDSLLWKAMLAGWSFSLFYHLCNGIRHLFWDAGYGFSLPKAAMSGWMVIICSLGLTIFAWLLAFQII